MQYIKPTEQDREALISTGMGYVAHNTVFLEAIEGHIKLFRGVYVTTVFSVEHGRHPEQMIIN